MATCPDCGRTDLKPVGKKNPSIPRHKRSIAERALWCRGGGRLINEPSGLHAAEVLY